MQNDFGEVEVSWVKVATIWGSVEPLRGREYFQADQAQAEVNTRIRVRYREGIMPKMRVIRGNQTFDIESVIDPETRNRELELMCRELL